LIKSSAVRRNLGWALLILAALIASMLFSIHVYVMPLPVAVVYFRPAFVDVITDPPGADVFVDGKQVLGTTPAVVEVKRDHQQHKIEVHKAGYAPAVSELRYDRRVHMQVIIQLAPLPRAPGP
jgi:hypothetical protein